MTEKEKANIRARVMNALDEISCNMIQLSTIWTTAFDDEAFVDELDEALCEKYPLEDSFDAIALRVCFWRDAVYEKLYGGDEDA